MLARVSNIESFRRWREDDDQTTDDLVRFLTEDKPTPAMIAGTAFHKAMETARIGSYETMEANGHTFLMPDAEISLPAIRELRGRKSYDDLIVTGQVDCLLGTIIEDHKTTSRCDPERYLAGYQWRYYLDIFEADTFRWNIFEIREKEPLVFEVKAPQILTAYRYPGLHDDCEHLAGEFLEFAKQVNLPEARI